MADSNAKKLAQLLDGNGDVLLTNLDNISVTPAGVSDQDNTSTGQFTLPAGTNAQRPVTSYTGAQRFNTDLGVMEFYDGTAWLKVSAQLAVLNSVTGNIYAGVGGSDLTLTGEGFLTNSIIVNFSQSSDGINTNVSVTAPSDTSATVAVPSAVYSNVTAGNVVTIKVTNSDSSQSSGVTKTAVALPSGGTITTSGDYKIHTFTSSGTFTNTISGLTADYLIVAGGGGGGGGAASTYHGGGGAGAGGLIYSTNQTLSSGSLSVGVGSGGSGGTGATNPGNNGNQGNNSSFNSVTAIGGGGGGGGQQYSSSNLNGGSGGGDGAGGTSSLNGTGTAGQGNNGGTHNGLGGHGGDPYGGGGGGAGAVGGNVSLLGMGNGGAGTANSITGSSVTYAGGGGGGDAVNGSNYASAGGGLGGAGGGGAGGSSGNGRSATGANGTDELGGGGGGGQGGTPQYNGGNGGSGIVIIRYDITSI